MCECGVCLCACECGVCMCACVCMSVVCVCLSVVCVCVCVYMHGAGVDSSSPSQHLMLPNSPHAVVWSGPVLIVSCGIFAWSAVPAK